MIATTNLAVPPPRRAWVEQLMGMPVSVHLRGRDSRSPETDACVQAVYDELRAVDVLFSPFLPDSLVRRVDRGELDPRHAHPLLDEVVDLCETARLLTDGAFDAWRRDPASGRRRFDPTGLVKGWAVERAAGHLAGCVASEVAVVAGGDVAVVGRGRRPSAWRVGLEDPADPSRVVDVVDVVSGGVATSGTARRGPHIADPRRSEPAEGALSVTVIGPSLTWADVLATAAFVMAEGAVGWLDGVAGYEGLVVDTAGVVWTTGGWPGLSQRSHR